MSKLFQSFIKLTALPVQAACFRTKVYYEDKKVQSRKIKGPAIVMSNHTSVYDFAVLLFVFFWRTQRYLMAETLFTKKRLGNFLRRMGGIVVDRNNFDFSFIEKSCEVLERGGVLGIFPESRIPVDGEERPLPFKPSVAYIALLSGAPIIPVYTDGVYFCRKRARVMIGKPIDVSALALDETDEKARLEKITTLLRQKITELRDALESRKKQKRRKKENG